ncbi:MULTISPECIES: PilZ domain-containing protein [Shewanella]|uniref:Cyclic diguanosine monophosphate-binding protein n=1 Tax=Shewanella oncorhynchi TaxID=2726434 RepID=A0ABX1KKA8_9GAMM|nr:MULTISPECIES: PilZ domain-containing protein [Shewanella]RBP81382.1 PilZ domain-containing protein [Shewanella putrefaciens]GCF89357.1 cyclic diguanosine monophosphate-binding protein [Shewanella sp. M-Br]AVI66864.1 PilZ domain-containing protein [Shewanella sp. WE21]MBI1675068.1 PilZ domain-containing protein [Shewanella sp. DW31]MBP6519207.1 PilZ domain-containing protein [Shewanella sp.]
MDERRKFSRILFATSAHLQQGGAQWETTILDLSLNGALVEEPQNFINSGDAITLSFALPESDIEIRMETELVHQKNAQLGLKCNFIDVDSISHLKRMVELNLGDASLLNRELMLFIEKHNITA